MNIAICGALRAGKDVVGDYLCERYGYTTFAFGDGLTSVCQALYPNQFLDGKKPRTLLQGFGQDARKYDAAVWTRKCFEAIDEAMKQRAGNMKAVILDLRQPSEYEECKSRGFVIVRVVAPIAERIQRAVYSGDQFYYTDLVHETEKYLDHFKVDDEIYNGGTLTSLYAKVDTMMNKMNRKKGGVTWNSQQR